MLDLPPGTTDETFRRIPARHREDAMQEAWLAHLEGRDPARAADTYRKRELRHERRQSAITDLLLEERQELDRTESL